MAKILHRSVAGFKRNLSYSLVKFVVLEVETPPSGKPRWLLTSKFSLVFFKVLKAYLDAKPSLCLKGYFFTYFWKKKSKCVF